VSSLCELCIRIQEYDPTKAAAIKNAAESEWCFGAWDLHKSAGYRQLRNAGAAYVTGDETYEEAALRVAAAVWKANGAYCPVTITAIDLDAVPCETYAFDEADYART
jgi:hypothetical protein